MTNAFFDTFLYPSRVLKRTSCAYAVKMYTAGVLIALTSGFGFAADLQSDKSANSAQSQKDLTPAQLAKPYDFWKTPYLLGDWAGWRTWLHNQGIDFNFQYSSETGYNFQGGNKHRIANAGQVTLGSKLDLQQLFGLDGATIKFDVVERHGRDLDKDANLGTNQQVIEIYGRGDIFRLADLYWQQKLFSDKLEFKIGRLGVDSDFTSYDCDFINLTFCGGQAGNLESYVYNWPISQWGAVIKTNLPYDIYFKTGIYDENTRYLDRNPTTAMAPNFPDHDIGALLPSELGWTPTFFDHYAGTYRIGGWVDTATARDVYLNSYGVPYLLDNSSAKKDRSRFGGYFGIKQQLTADTSGYDPKHGLYFSFNMAMGDLKTEKNNYQLYGTLSYHGPFDERPDDDIGLAIGGTHVNPRYAKYEILANALGKGPGYVQGMEMASELYYAAQLTGWLNLRASIQYIGNPGGVQSRKDAIVGTFRATANF